jgi:transglutaminase-like putative cysteine protease
MNKNSLIASWAVALLISGAARVFCQTPGPGDIPPGVTIVSYVTYKVRMVTDVTPLPDGSVGCVRVWHAIPDHRPWSLTGSEIGATNISCDPPTGKQEYDKKYQSQDIYWSVPQPIAGHLLSFATEYTVRSAHRTFNPGQAVTTWPANFTPPADVNPTLAGVADGIRSQFSPANAVLEFSKWIANYMTYDAGVSYAYNDVGQILLNRRGHCGHYATLFHELCRRVGIPERTVFGLNLDVPDGTSGDLQTIRADYTNQHTWAEVNLPGAGWIEVEPSAGANAYDIPANYIQDNASFQLYAPWALQNNVWLVPPWTNQDGHYYSAYNISNITRYSIVSQTSP